MVVKKVLETYEFPSISFEQEINVEIGTNGDVFINGVLLKGVKLANYRDRSMYMSYYDSCYRQFVEVEFCMPFGTINVRVRDLKFLASNIPTTAKLVQTEEVK